MFAELEVFLWRLMWRLTWWLVAFLLRLFWLPLLILGLIYYVALPALTALLQLVLSPGGVLVAALLLLWLWRR